MVVQSILIDGHWGKAVAMLWLKAHDYRATVEKRGLYWRARQHNPDCFRKGSFRTIRFGEGIKAVVGKLKV